MKKLKNSTYLYGIYMLAGFLLYFFVMKLLGLYTEPIFRIFNVIIHGSVVYLAMKAFRRNREDNPGWGHMILVGMQASAIGVIGFALFQLLYLEVLDPGFLAFVKENAIMGDFLTPTRASFFLLAEGLGVSVFFSYLSTRYIEYQEIKASHNGHVDMDAQVEWRTEAKPKVK
jgi:hypothetical protein